MKKFLRKVKGFTLVELLIVLLILGILIGLAVPRYLEATRTAKTNTFCANVRALASAIETYRMNNNGALPADAAALNGLIADPNYFSQPPKNPFTGQTLNATSAAPSADGMVQYTVNGDTYTLATQPGCGLQ